MVLSGWTACLRSSGSALVSDIRRRGLASEPGGDLDTEKLTDVEPSRADSDIFSSIEKLAGPGDKGVISEEEFSAKTSDLLKRL